MIELLAFSPFQLPAESKKQILPLSSATGDMDFELDRKSKELYSSKYAVIGDW
jgi:hypothetical protein